MKIAVMGAGAIGGYFGGRLAQAGYDVSFIARGAHLAAIKANGLKVLSPLGDFTIKPANVTDDPADVGVVDVVLFMVKNYDTRQAAEQIRPLVGPDTAIIPFQNGVDARALLSEVLGAGHVLGGVAFIPASIPEPGVIKHNAELAKLVFGEFDRQVSPRAVAFLDALEKAGVAGEISADINVVLWSKLMFLTSMSAINCITRQAAGLVQSDEETMALYMGRGHRCQHGAGTILPAAKQDVYVPGPGSRSTSGNQLSERGRGSTGSGKRNRHSHPSHSLGRHQTLDRWSTGELVLFVFCFRRRCLWHGRHQQLWIKSLVEPVDPPVQMRPGRPPCRPDGTYVITCPDDVTCADLKPAEMHQYRCQAMSVVDHDCAAGEIKIFFRQDNHTICRGHDRSAGWHGNIDTKMWSSGFTVENSLAAVNTRYRSNGRPGKSFCKPKIGRVSGSGLRDPGIFPADAFHGFFARRDHFFRQSVNALDAVFSFRNINPVADFVTPRRHNRDFSM